MKKFLDELSFNIWMTKECSKQSKLSFPHFLGLLDKKNLAIYNKLVSNAITGNIESDDCIQKVILLYTYIIKEVEKKESVSIDSERKWLFSLLNFLTMETFYRHKLIDGYEGFLHAGKINIKSNQRLEELLKQYSK